MISLSSVRKRFIKLSLLFGRRDSLMINAFEILASASFPITSLSPDTPWIGLINDSFFLGLFARRFLNRSNYSLSEGQARYLLRLLNLFYQIGVKLTAHIRGADHDPWLRLVVGIEFPHGRAFILQTNRLIRAEGIDRLFLLLFDIGWADFRFWLAQSELIWAVELHYNEAWGALLGLKHPAFAEKDVQDCVIPDGVVHEWDVYTRWQLFIDLEHFFLKDPQLLIFLYPLHVTKT